MVGGFGPVGSWQRHGFWLII